MMDKDKFSSNKFYRAVGDLDEEFLQEFEMMENMEGKEMKCMKKKMNWIAVAACCVLLTGAGTGLVRQFAGGGVFVWNDAEKSGYSFSADHISHEVYEEREDGLYYIFEGAEVNVTEYCSDTDYILAPVLDAGGTGYVAVLGGEKGERGFLLHHYEQGELLIGQTEHELVTYSRMVQPILYREIVDSALPQFVWNHHATHFMGLNLDENWYQSAEIIENDYGTAEKIGDNLYYVQGQELGFYTPREQVNYVSEECWMQVDWLTSFGGSHPSELQQEGDTLELYTQDQWTEVREAEIRAVLDEIGFPYELEFKG